MKVDVAPEKGEFQIVVAKGTDWGAVKSMSVMTKGSVEIKRKDLAKIFDDMLEELGVVD